MNNFDIKFVLIKNYMALDEQFGKVLIPKSAIHLVECTEPDVKDEINGVESEEEKLRREKVN